MSDVVNFKKFRKQKARAEKKAQAEANAVKFGRSKAQKSRDKAEQSRSETRHEEHKLDP